MAQEGVTIEANDSQRNFLTNVTTKHKKVLISVKQKEITGGDNICIKYNRQESNFKTSHRLIKKNSKSLKN